MNDHLAFTGTKEKLTAVQHDRLTYHLTQLRKHFNVMHNGDCVGADSVSFSIWRNLNGMVVLHPPSNPKYRAFNKCDHMLPEEDYIVRDHKMVNSSSFLLGCSKTMNEYLRSGTWATIRYARKVGIPILIIFPDGSTKFEKPSGINALLYDVFN